MKKPKKVATTIDVILFTSKTLATGEHPIMIRVTRDKERKYVSTGFSSSVKDWNDKKGEPRTSHIFKSLIDKKVSSLVSKYKAMAEHFEKEETEYNPEKLIERVANPKLAEGTLFSFCEEIIARLIESKQIGNSQAYKDMMRSVKNYTNDKDLKFDKVTVTFLNKYETFLRNRDLKETTISVYFRTLRALYKKAIDEKLVNKEDYPFDTFKVSKFSTKTRKRAIAIEHVKAMELLEFSTNTLIQEARDFFLFMYYCAGMNIIDMALLKWENIEGEYIHYERAKTGGLINFKIHPKAKEIISRYEPVARIKKSVYVFPILDSQFHKSATQIDDRVKKVTGRINKDLKEIAKLINCDTPITTYVARHTFASTLHSKGQTMATIGGLMGHETEKVTTIYLAELTNNTEKDSAIDLL